MTTYNHTQIATGAAANASVINSPLGEMDAAIGDLTGLSTSATTLVTAINELLTELGDVGDLDTSATDVVNAVNEVLTNLGNVGSLQTTSATAVTAINELLSELGNVMTLTTSAKVAVDAINEVLSEIVAARQGYTDLDSRLDTLTSAGQGTATQANGAAAAAQKIVTVDSTTGFLAGAAVSYLLAGATLETNTIDTIDSGTQFTFLNNIGTGGINDNEVIYQQTALEAAMAGGYDNASDRLYGIDQLPGAARLAAAVSSGLTFTTRIASDPTYRGLAVLSPFTSGTAELVRITSITGSTVTVDSAISNSHAQDAAVLLLYGAPPSVEMFGAVGDGTTDDSTAFQNAVTFAATRDARLVASGATYYIDTMITFADRLQFDGYNSTIDCRLPSPTTNDAIFRITGNEVEIENFKFDGSNLPDNASDPDAKRIIFVEGTYASQRKALRFRNLEFDNFTYNGDGSAQAVVHCIYAVGTEDMEITKCRFLQATGAAVIIHDSDGVWVKHNYIDDIAYYPIHVYGSTTAVRVLYNWFGENVSANFGGLIDCMGYEDNQKCRDFVIEGNVCLGGEADYSGAIRVLGVNGLVIKNNIFDMRFSTTVGILLNAREVSGTAYSDPSQNAIISGNVLRFRGSDTSPVDSYGITVRNSRNTVDGHNYQIHNNIIVGDGTNYWAGGIRIGNSASNDLGTINNVSIKGNIIEWEDTAASSAISGITVVGKSGDVHDHITIKGNELFSQDNSDTGDIGIYIVQYASNITIADNKVDNTYFPIRIDSTGVDGFNIYNNDDTNTNASGFINISAVNEFAIDDTTPSLSGARLWSTQDSHTADRTITAFDHVQPGVVYVITANTGATYKTIIQRNSNVLIDSDWDDTANTFLIVMGVAGDKVWELHRG